MFFLGTTLIVIGVISVISLGLGIYSAVAGAQAGADFENDTLKAKGLDDFGITKADEGQSVVKLFGKNRVPTNILWYGNLTTKPIYSSGGGGGGKGGGGGGGGSQVTAYKYFLDIWHGICEGKAEIVRKWVNNRLVEEEPSELFKVEETVFNDGTQATTLQDINFKKLQTPGDITLIGPIPGLCWIYYKQYRMLENSSNLPVLHLEMKRILETALPHENLTNGSNPSAIVYQLLLDSGVSVSKIDFDSFSSASIYWFNKEYGLNLRFDSVQPVKNMRS
jgi:hypothetical protein